MTNEQLAELKEKFTTFLTTSYVGMDAQSICHIVLDLITALRAERQRADAAEEVIRTQREMNRILHWQPDYRPESVDDTPAFRAAQDKHRDALGHYNAIKRQEAQTND